MTKIEIEQEHRIEARTYTRGENGRPVITQAIRPEDGHHHLKDMEFDIKGNSVYVPDVNVRKTLEPGERFAASNGGGPVDFVGVVCPRVVREGISTSMLYFPKT